MTLDEYLTKKAITEAAFAKQIGRSPSFVNRLRKNQTWPLWETMERICDATSGAVTANDFASAKRQAVDGAVA